MTITTPVEKQELEPCPFCGAPADLVEVVTDDRWHCQCSNYQCAAGEGMRLTFHTSGRAVQAWNTRVDSVAALTAERDRLREKVGELVMLLLQRQFDEAREIALVTPVEFYSGKPRAALEERQ